jgi:hypothetical protein
MSGLLVSRLSRATGLPEADIQRVMRNAPRRYKVFRIRKRTKGWREIAQPAVELKLIQRAALRLVLKDAKVHRVATAYERGSNIRANAAAHAGAGPILKIDFKDFFPSISEDDWKIYCESNLSLDEEEVDFLARVFFRQRRPGEKLRLSIGAPSSPHLSNILMYDFDKYVFREASRRGISYTRYADDLTFSGQRIGMLADMLKVVRRAVRRRTAPTLRINRDKTNFVTSAYSRRVTGLVLANDGAVGLGRERRRTIRATVKHAVDGKLSIPQLQELCGLLSFVKVVEPAFLDRLSSRYGQDVIQTIQSVVIIPQGASRG